MISQQIQWASASRGSLLRPGEDPALAGTWAKYFHYYRELLGVTNKCIQGSDPHGGKCRALNCIFALFGIDVQFEESMWQAHLNAGLAYAEKVGGLEALLTFPTEFSAYALKDLKRVLLASIMCNTTSPASKQVRGVDTYTDAEMTTIIESVEILEPPLAVDIFIAIARVTELRVQAATGAAAKTVINEAARHRLDELESFDADAWVREHGLGEYPLVSATAQIYRVATQLYGALTLGRAFAAWWPADGKVPRRVLQERLIRLLGAMWDRIGNHGTLLWPLIIAGVAAADGDAEERAFIGRCFQIGSRTRSMFVKFSRCVKKVERIWLEGTTDWENCFAEPFVCIA
ncbi:C6 zinc finger domain protein [Akanthomyces lecanii RCEF 1005]|uniref:C6 zinc finger domain protein n=1 Tax=Akanthomyces lecanii RCEF 1005 TaxID=1081108 RepID=A0A168C4B1_CORDF|nr:C6 zinc finger domain protein [Akanthomyces lecanii RCEF 1005]